MDTMANKTKMWKVRFEFELTLPEDRDSELTDNDFKNPSSETNMSVFKLYSLETFIYWKLNASARNMDKSTIETMGCFACVLSRALEIANRYRQEQMVS